LYLRRIYKGDKEIIGKDDQGYFTRWNEMAVLNNDIYKELESAVMSNEVQEVKWKTNRLVVANNFTTLHRRTPFTYPDGERIIFRAYVN
jgi:alpha-ketoglutarate-dependent taurine dioxygenase